MQTVLCGNRQASGFVRCKIVLLPEYVYYHLALNLSFGVQVHREERPNPNSWFRLNPFDRANFTAGPHQSPHPRPVRSRRSSGCAPVAARRAGQRSPGSGPFAGRRSGVCDREIGCRVFSTITTTALALPAGGAGELPRQGVREGDRAWEKGRRRERSEGEGEVERRG